MEGQVPVFITPRNRVAQLYPRALGSLFVASYDSQGLRWRYSNPRPHGFAEYDDEEIQERAHLFSVFGQDCVEPCEGLLTNSVALVRERPIPTERPPLIGEVSANFWG
jgi:hypothetical protein